MGRGYPTQRQGVVIPCRYFLPIIINFYMSSNGTEGRQKDSPLLHFHIPMTLPFKITPFSLRSGSKYDRDGHWNEKERLKYSIFLSYFHSLFNDPTSRKNIRIYDMMSDMIITRNANQCRSHHQKMEKHRNGIPEIIASVAERYEPRIYEEQKAKYLLLIKNILENQQKYIRTTTAHEEVKYFYTTWGSEEARGRTESGEREEKGRGKGRGKEGEGEKVETEGKINKEDRIKTADSYLNVQLYQEEDHNVDQIPAMDPLDPKLEQEEDSQNNALPVPMAQNPPIQQTLTYPAVLPSSGYFSSQGNLMLTPQGRLYYEQQIKLMQMKREWHFHNSQQLSSQLQAEQQSIRHCDMTIRVYQLALGSPNPNPNPTSQ